MGDTSVAERARQDNAADPATLAIIAAERQRCIDRVLAYVALRDQAAVDLDKTASGPGPEKPSEGASERARMQAEVARDIARFLGEATTA